MAIMKKHAQVVARRCDTYHKHENMIHLLAKELHPMFIAWLFTQWGLDIVGPLKRELSNKRFLLVSTDYFSK